MPVRRSKRLLVGCQQEPGAEAVFLQNFADLGHKPAADLNIPDGASMRLPARHSSGSCQSAHGNQS